MASSSMQTEVNVYRYTEIDHTLLVATIPQVHLRIINQAIYNRYNIDISQLAKEDPRDAYVWLFGSVFTTQFIDFRDDDWDIGSVEEDGLQAFTGLTQYVEDMSPPDPDINEIEVMLSVWKHPGFLDILRGKRHVSEVVTNFMVYPPDLAGSGS